MPAVHNRERDTTDYSDPLSNRSSDYNDHRPGYRDERERDSGSRSSGSDDREISLGTGTILAIFFALALVCAVFFGLGYSMGRKSAQSPTVVAASSEPLPSSTFSSFKPPAGSLPSQSSQKKNSEAAPPAPTDPDATIVTSPVSAAAHKESSSGLPPAPVVREAPRTSPPASASPSPASPTAAPAIDPNGTAIVQVAAVSHQEDADTLVTALKKRGYTVFIRQEPQDKLLHVQIGPFANKKDAEAMRQRLLSDGYNAIIK